MKKSKQALASLIVTTGAAVCILVVGSFAWMNYNREINVLNLTLECVKSNSVGIAFDPTNFKEKISTSYEGKTFTQMSGDGANFYTYKSDYDDVGSGASALTLTGFEKVSEDKYDDFMYRTPFFIKTDWPVHLYMSSISFVSPADIEMRKNFGFSKDYVAGAIRIGLNKVDEEGNQIPFLIWAPNSTYEADISKETPTFNPDGKVESSYSIVNGTELTNLIRINTDNQPSGMKRIEKGNYVGPNFLWGNLTSDLFLEDISQTTEYSLSIWLEGTDRECIRALSGGQIKLKIAFSSMAIEEE